MDDPNEPTSQRDTTQVSLNLDQPSSELAELRAAIDQLSIIARDTQVRVSGMREGVERRLEPLDGLRKQLVDGLVATGRAVAEVAKKNENDLSRAIASLNEKMAARLAISADGFNAAVRDAVQGAEEQRAQLDALGARLEALLSKAEQTSPPRSAAGEAAPPPKPDVRIDAIVRELAWIKESISKPSVQPSEPPRPDPRIDGIASELASIKAALAKPAPAAPVPAPQPDPRIGEVVTELASIKAALAKPAPAAPASAPQPDPRIGEVVTELASIKAALAKPAPAAPAPAPQPDPRIGEVVTELASIKAALAKPAPQGPGPDPRLGELVARFTAVEERIASLGAALERPSVTPPTRPPQLDEAALAARISESLATSTKPLGDQIAQIGARAAELERAVRAMAERPVTSQPQDGIAEKLEAIDRALRAPLTQLNDRIGELGQRMSSFEKELVEAHDERAKEMAALERSITEIRRARDAVRLAAAPEPPPPAHAVEKGAPVVALEGDWDKAARPAAAAPSQVKPSVQKPATAGQPAPQRPQPAQAQRPQPPQPRRDAPPVRLEQRPTPTQAAPPRAPGTLSPVPARTTGRSPVHAPAKRKRRFWPFGKKKQTPAPPVRPAAQPQRPPAPAGARPQQPSQQQQKPAGQQPVREPAKPVVETPTIAKAPAMPGQPGPAAEPAATAKPGPTKPKAAAKTPSKPKKPAERAKASTAPASSRPKPVAARPVVQPQLSGGPAPTKQGDGAKKKATTPASRKPRAKAAAAPKQAAPKQAAPKQAAPKQAAPRPAPPKRSIREGSPKQSAEPKSGNATMPKPSGRSGQLAPAKKPLVPAPESAAAAAAAVKRAARQAKVAAQKPPASPPPPKAKPKPKDGKPPTSG